MGTTTKRKKKKPWVIIAPRLVLLNIRSVLTNVGVYFVGGDGFVVKGGVLGVRHFINKRSPLYLWRPGSFTNWV
jgi:hypothetical protein